MEVEGFLPEELICANVSHLHNLVPGQELGFPKDTVDIGLQVTPHATLGHWRGEASAIPTWSVQKNDSKAQS